MKTFCYDPGRTYSLAEFEEVNSSTRAHDVKMPLRSRLQETPDPMPQTPVEKEAAVGEIFRQIANWNIRTRQNGVPTSRRVQLSRENPSPGCGIHAKGEL